ncbi:terpene cyclase/mutase family protein [Rhodopirellula sp. JC740]|uniref:Terpene cyclase/mutase family protein n=1 Tax=Rhodopirellula halodulae TaxID=2894198 RepID=A0ABS8NH47_9BACT|nr:prenyltransferase/squalene oxidase repeat-containing protein [Rhodopirellula sp. JC740]MCC9642865.1 terpene cyclase/mutase family protein [Rhodopirellula sp. JC740]
MNIQLIRTAVCCLTVGLSLFAGGEKAASQETTSVSLKAQAIEKGLRYVASAGERWIEKRGCVSCHQVPTLIWSHQIAVELDAPGARDKLRQWSEWSVNVVNFVKPEQKADVDHDATMSANIDTMTQLLLAIPEPQTNTLAGPGMDSTWRTKFANHLKDEQAPDGSWRACGQLPAQRRPQPETTATTTAWTSLALLREGVVFDLQSALEVIDAIENAQSTEFLAARLLLTKQLATTRDISIREKGVEELLFWRERLIEMQNDDGGWGWKAEESSDALGTGYALYALAIAGADASVLQAATNHLVSTQEASGRWKVPGTKASAKGRPTATANDWGSAWAVIALSTTVKHDG